MGRTRATQRDVALQPARLPKVAFLLQGAFSFSRPNPQSRCDLTELAFFLKEQTHVHVRLSPIEIHSS